MTKTIDPQDKGKNLLLPGFARVFPSLSPVPVGSEKKGEALPSSPPPKKRQRSSASSVAATANKPTGDQEILRRWNFKGSAGFWNWGRDIKPRVLNKKNRWETWTPTPGQRKEINSILKSDDTNTLIHGLSLLIQPRRHGKSTIFRLIVLYLTMARRNHLTQLLGNTELHSRRTQYKPLKGTIENTPKLRALFRDDWLTAYEISYPPMQSSIQMSTGVSVATAFGEKLNVLWVSDFHAAEDLGAWNAFQASLLDSEGSAILIDSNVDPFEGHVHDLQRESENDDSMHCTHIEYKDLAEYFEKAPSWIDRAKVKRMEKTQLPVDFRRDILGQRSSATNALFPEIVIKKSKSPYKIPVDNVSEFVKGRAFKIAGGLDRAKSLIGKDKTVWTVLLKTVDATTNEPEYFVISQRVFQFNASRFIKKQILDDHQKYDLCNIALENYEITDLAPWLGNKNIPYEIVNPTSPWQNNTFPKFAQAAKEGRFHVSKYARTMLSEMRTFVYKQKPGTGYIFEAGADKFHDDTIYSTNLAMFALRDQVLHTYQLGNFTCANRRALNRHLCILFGGDQSLLCRIRCEAYGQIEEMFDQYKKLKPLDDCTIEEFFKQRVELTGARISQAI